MISLCALKKWRLWSLGIKDAFLQADPFPREVYPHAPLEWCPKNPNRAWRLNAPPYGLNDAPVEFRETLRRYLLQSETSLKLAGLRFEVSALGPCLFIVYNREKKSAGVFSSHIDDILGCGAPGTLDRTRYCMEQRFGPLKVQEDTMLHVGMELVQEADFSVEHTRAEFSRQLKLLDTSPAFWKRRRRPLSDEEKLLCQCKMGELCWLATVSRPDICARLAQLASKVNEIQGSDSYRINSLMKTVKIGQPRAVLKYASSPYPLFPAGLDTRGRRRTRGEKVHGGTLSLVGWADAACGDLSQRGKCRLGYLIGPCRVSQWTSKFTHKLAKGSLGGEVFAFSEMIGHMALLREFYAPFPRISPGMVSMEDRESLCTHFKNREMVTGKYLVRHFSPIQQFIEDGELGNAYWLPRGWKPGRRTFKIESEMGPILSLSETGRFQPGLLRPLKGLAFHE